MSSSSATQSADHISHDGGKSGASIHHLPTPSVRRALEEIATIGALALDAWRSGDRDLVRDCERWHGQRQAVISGARRGGYRRQAVRR